MLKSLPLIVVILLSIFLAFYCVGFHKDTILSILKIEENRTTQPVIEESSNKVVSVETEIVGVEENQTVNCVDVGVESKDSLKREEDSAKESLYVESLAVEAVSEKVTPSVEVLQVEEKKEVAEDVPLVVEPIKKSKVEVVDDKEVSESTKGYALDELEKMILEELKNGEEK
jgi:hypothetical protein